MSVDIEEETSPEWEAWTEGAFSVLPEEASFSEVVTAAYMLLNMYNISIDLACEGMLEVYKQDISPIPKGYKLN